MSAIVSRAAIVALYWAVGAAVYLISLWLIALAVLSVWLI